MACIDPPEKKVPGQDSLEGSADQAATPEPTAKRRKRARGQHKSPGQELSTLDSLEAAINLERALLNQIKAMLRCLYEVLLYADDDDSIMHADVVRVSARLLGECIHRLELVAKRYSHVK